MIKRLDKIDNDFNIFKIKAYGFMTVVTAIMNLALEFFKNKKEILKWQKNQQKRIKRKHQL